MKKTEEEIVAIKLERLLSDIRLDLDEVGSTLASISTYQMLLRLENIYLSACESAGILVERKRDTSDII
jgi:hypothetical protein